MDHLEEIRIFCEIAAQGSLVGAARKIGRAAPAVTRALNSLEQRLGTRLIERTTRRIALTESGKRLAENAHRILDDLDAALADAMGHGSQVRGTLRITAPLVFGQRHLAPVVTRFLDEHREVSIELALVDRFVDLIEEGFDVGLRIGHLADSSFVTTRIGAVSRVFVASPSYLAKSGIPLVPADLDNHSIILFAQTASGYEWNFRLASSETITQRIQARYTVNRAELAITAALEGRGITSTLSYQVADHLKRGELVRLMQPYEQPALPVQFVYPSKRFLAGRLSAFIKYAAPRLRSLPQLRMA
ncbi:MAG: LysR family transcriptional regulator [Rhizobiaceae bacterium]